MAEEPSNDAPAETVYLVRRRRAFCYLRTDWSGSRRLPVERNVRLFRTSEEADAFCEGLNTGRIPSPPDANPFLCFCDGFDGDETCLPFSSDPEFGVTEDDFATFVRTLGLEPPELRELKQSESAPVVGRDWFAWWERLAPALSDELRGRLWQNLGEFWYYYEIAELELHAPPGDPLSARS